ncbi:sensor histidine kinase [Streptomyces pseudogriseolus]|uniref:sensor histidine kinase n=1 Tax=Streptomyces pseudogriseolus TaxID=36817 RepID=UPI003FA1CDF3
MRIPLPGPRSLAGQLFAMQAVLLTVVVAGYALATYLSNRSEAEQAAGRQATSVALSVADSPSVREAIRSSDPSVRLQPYAVAVVRDTDVDFVTIMDPRGIRWTHPDPDQIGLPFQGHTEPALQGRTFTETYTGTLGPSVRAVTPVRDGGRIVGLVSAGIRVEEIGRRVQEQLAALLAVAGGALGLGAVGTYVINARLRRHTHGMNAAELSHMHDYHQAALHAVREGLLMLDGQYRVALINDGGRELLGVDQEEDVVGRSVAELGLPAPLTGALLASEPRVDEVHLTADRVLVVNTSPVTGGERRGSVVTLRDVTELQSLMGELDSERGFTQALRSQAHEAANRLHTVVSLIELGRAEEAVEFATAELELAQALTDQVVAAVSEPVLAALLLGKTAQANERGVELVVSADSRLDDGLLPDALPSRDLVTILGNLIDNAVDAAQGGVRPRVTVTARTEEDGSELVLRVGDTGPGVDPDRAEELFRLGYSTKPSGPGGRGLGLALVRQAVSRHGGTLTVTSGEDGGAAFDVRVPLRGTAGAVVNGSGGAAAGGSGSTAANGTGGADGAGGTAANGADGAGSTGANGTGSAAAGGAGSAAADGTGGTAANGTDGAGGAAADGAGGAGGAGSAAAGGAGGAGGADSTTANGVDDAAVNGVGGAR